MPEQRRRFSAQFKAEAVFHNRQRLHSTLGYRTPAEALTHHQLRTAA